MLITIMTAFQLIYDVAFFSVGTSDIEATSYYWSYVLTIWGGSGSALASNVMIFFMIYMAVKLKSFNLEALTYQIVAICSTPGFIIIFVYLAGVAESSRKLQDLAGYFYFGLRIISIFINVLTLGYIHIKVNSLKKLSKSLSSAKKPQNKMKLKAIQTLIYRLQFYPLIQVLTRFGIAWYDSLYGFNFTPSPHGMTKLHFGAQCVIVFVTPLGPGKLRLIKMILLAHFTCLKVL